MPFVLIFLSGILLLGNPLRYKRFIKADSSVDWKLFYEQEYYFSKIIDVKEQNLQNRSDPFCGVPLWESVPETFSKEVDSQWIYQKIQKTSPEHQNIGFIYDLYQYVQFLKKLAIGGLLEDSLAFSRIFEKNLDPEWMQDEIAPYIKPSTLVELITQQWKSFFEENSPENVFFPILKKLSQQAVDQAVDREIVEKVLSTSLDSFDQKIESAFWFLLYGKGGAGLGSFFKELTTYEFFNVKLVEELFFLKDKKQIHKQSKNVVDFLKKNLQISYVPYEMIQLYQGLWICLGYDISSDYSKTMDVLLALESHREMMQHLHYL